MQAKQSVRRVYAVSAKAKDMREVVKRLNLFRQERDCARDAAALEAAARAWQAGLDGEQQTAPHLRSTPRSTRAWDVFLQARLMLLVHWCVLSALTSTRISPSGHRLKLMVPQGAAPDQPDSGYEDEHYVTALPEALSKRQKHAHAEAGATGVFALNVLCRTCGALTYT